MRKMAENLSYNCPVLAIIDQNSTFFGKKMVKNLPFSIYWSRRQNIKGFFMAIIPLQTQNIFNPKYSTLLELEEGGLRPPTTSRYAHKYLLSFDH